MEGTHRLTDEAMEQIRASDAFRNLGSERAADVETVLYTRLAGEAEMTRSELERRLDAHLERILPDPAAIRAVILEALRTS